MAKQIEHSGTRWSKPNGQLHVLVEHPDLDGLDTRGAVLRAAGYEVALCAGPQAGSRRDRTTCPLVSGGDCTLVDHADVVVTSCLLRDGDAIIGALENADVPLVVETSPTTTPRELLSAVAAKLSNA
jgi:hypothetical protein